MIKNIPPHIFWPGMVVSILGFSVLANMYLLSKAAGDGGAQVIDNYYEKAAGWDQAKAAQAKTDDLGWEFTVNVSHTKAAMELRDKGGQELTGRDVTLVLRNPGKNSNAKPLKLSEVEPGVYETALELTRMGLWDLEFRISEGGETHIFERRVNVSSK